MLSSWQVYVFDVEAIRSHPHYACLQCTYITNEFLFAYLVTALCIWAKAILLAGIVSVCYRQLTRAREELAHDLEAGEGGREKFEDVGNAKEELVDLRKLWDSSNSM
ncbi:hypothetical protein BDZ45DRAFT_749203 [Acephala macrosclerotiorum]|nr:hypothetical protein BDZ45DRAFT_749203 [Acephala macrosclerotiorum]